MRRLGAAVLTAALATTLVTGLVAAPAIAAPAAASPPQSHSRLTNLAHLDFLTDRVSVQPSAAHSTYQLAQQPEIGVLWVYADARDGGTFARVGGGPYDAATNTYSQGAFDTDDITRAAVVYLREWRATGSSHAKEQAYQLLRGLGYFQTLTGPKAGEVVLWMQPDGTLNPSPTPVELPDPSDSDASYWLARSLWAFGEGYAAFKHSDPAFAAFLASRMDLAITALNRDVLTRYGQYQSIHGVKVPAWLIVDGADASSEAMLGLSAYVKARGSRVAADALAKLSRGVAQMSAGNTTTWPFRALLPWALSQSDWHAWGAQMGSGLAAAATVLDRRSLLKPAVDDAAGFSAQLLTSTGPVNGLLPTPTDRVQIAYGADARVQSLLAVGKAAHSKGIRQLAGIAAGWFFGANASGSPTYNPATGVTFDGVQPDGTVNRNSGAESAIHGLLTMQALDANPDLKALALASSSIGVRDGLTMVEAESGTLSGPAAVTTPAEAWTGESLWSGDYVRAGDGSVVTWTLPAGTQPRLVQPVVELINGSPARTVFTAGRSTGVVRYGAVGPQGDAQAVGMLSPVDAHLTLAPGKTTVTARTSRGTGNIDALMVMPVVASLVSSGNGHATAVLTSKSKRSETRWVTVAGSGRATVRSYDRDGREVRATQVNGSSVRAFVAPGGFTILTR